MNVFLSNANQNIDYKNVNKNKNASDLLDGFFASGILPTIKRPTRITHISATIIDHLYVKCNGYNNVDSRILLLNIRHSRTAVLARCASIASDGRHGCPANCLNWWAPYAHCRHVMRRPAYSV